MKKMASLGNRSLVILSMIGCVTVSSDLFALPTFSPGDLSGMTDAAVKSLIQTIAIGGDHHAYMPATPLGYTLGFDLGVDVTAISVPSEFKDALQLATQATSADIPSLIPVPRLNFHKGLPWDFDLGFSFIAYQGLVRMVAGEVKWAYLDGSGAFPALAARASVNFGKVWFLESRTYTLDVLISKNFYIVDPYVGFGFQYWNGDLVVPAGAISQLPTGVSASQSSINPHFYLGVPLKLSFLKLTAELDYSLAKVMTFGGKVSFGF